MTAAERLDEIQARANAATEGPWAVRGDEDYGYEVHGQREASSIPGVWRPTEVCGPGEERNAEFIAHARADVPALVAALRAVLDLHRKGTIYYHADHCENHSDEHIAERHDEYSDAMGEYYCRDLPMHDVCRECSGVFEDEFESAEFPCPTVRAVEAALGEVAP